MAKVVFKYGTRAQYDAVASKDANSLYFLTDTGEIYRGDKNLARGMHYEGTKLASDADHAAVITRVLNGATPVQDDIFVVKEQISGEKYSYTSYIYDASAWKAMDGNYSAENVYFKDDITVTTKVGTIQTLTNGSATWSTAGKNVKQALQSLFAQEDTDPAITLPTASFTTSASVTTGNYEPGSVISGTAGYTLGLATTGSYEFGPTVAGVAASSYSIRYLVSGSDSVTYTDASKSGLAYSFTVDNSDKTVRFLDPTVNYSAATNYANSNLGNATTKKISASAATGTAKTYTYTSKRKSFWVADTNTAASFPQDTDANKTSSSYAIRSFANNEFGVKTYYELAITKGMKRVIIAVPGSHTMSSCIDVDGMGLDVKANFSTQTVKVGGADATSSSIGSYSTDYTVFSFVNDAGFDKTTFKITLA